MIVVDDFDFVTHSENYKGVTVYGISGTAIACFEDYAATHAVDYQ